MDSVVIFCALSLPFGIVVSGLTAPSFESGWLTMIAQDTSNCDQEVSHNLGEHPVKVDVQVRVQESGVNYIFTGTGSGHRDDDFDGYYGGVVYLYNSKKVKLYVPLGDGGLFTTKGLAIYTGGSGTTGSTLISGSYSSVEVKVRAWKLCDVGTPAWVNQWTPISESAPYHTITHGLGVYPDLVSVQVSLDTSSYFSDAQGSAGVGDKVNSNSFKYGGVLYGYNDSEIRMWAPDPGYIFTTIDGWGTSSSKFASGCTRIMMWVFPPSETLFQQTLTMGIGLSTNYEVPFSQAFDTDAILVSTEITVMDGNNAGFRFYGTGSSMNDGSLGTFGGVVYAYTDSQVLLWRPSNSSGGKMVYIGTAWANGTMSQMSDIADVTIRVIVASGTVTGPSGYGGNVTCSCDPGYSGSDCTTAPNCGVPVSVTNALKMYSGTTERRETLYSCSKGYYATSGDLQQTCSCGQWVGDTPVCSASCSSNVPVVLTAEELDERLEELVRNTEVSVKNTSAYKRSLICANDPRPASFYVGSVGIVLLTIVIVFPLLVDSLNLYEICQRSHKDSVQNDHEDGEENNEPVPPKPMLLGNFFGRRSLPVMLPSPVYHP